MILKMTKATQFELSWWPAPEKFWSTRLAIAFSRLNPVGSHFNQSFVIRQLAMLSGNLMYQGETIRAVNRIHVINRMRGTFFGRSRRNTTKAVHGKTKK